MNIEQIVESNINILEDQVFQVDPTGLSIKEIKREFQALSNNLKQDIQDAKEAKNHRLNFILSTEACELLKSYGIYLRDAYLQKIYANIKFKSSLITAEQLEQFELSQLKEYENIRSKYLIENKATYSDKQLNDPSAIEEHLLTENPYNVYLDQFELLRNQLIEIQGFGTQINQLNLKIKYVLDSLLKPLDMLKTKLSDFEKMGNELNLTNTESLTNILNVTSKFAKEIDIPFTKHKELNAFVDDLMTINAYPNHQSGLLEHKEIDTSDLIRNWIGIFAYPSIESLEKKASQIINNLNLKLKYYLDSIENFHEDELSELKQWNASFKTELHDLVTEIQLKETEFEQKLNVNSIVYSDNDLSINFQNTYEQIRGNAGGSLDKIKDYIISQIDYFKNIFWHSNDQYTLNDQIVQSLKIHRKGEQNSLYKKLFLNESGLHDQVIIPRVDENKKLEETIDVWTLGIGNSVLLIGNKLCGKTTFINSLDCSISFDQKIMLLDSKEIIIEGRKFVPTKNIKENYDLVLKNISPLQKYLVVIEDLESQRDSELNSFQNTSNLMGIIDNAPSNIFFICSCNVKFYNKINTLLDCENVFTSIIDLSIIGLNEFNLTVHKRLEILHASRKSIEEINNSKIRNLAKKVLINNESNLGLSLLSWIENIDSTGSISSTKFHKSEFPWILNSNNIQLLDNLLTYGSCTYQELLQNFAFEKKPKIKNLISRYRRLGVVDNNEDQIFINKFLINKIERQLNYIENKNIDLKDYTLKVKLLGLEETKLMISEIKNNLFFFPFASPDSKVSVEKNNTYLEIGIEAVEPPSKIIKYLNNKSTEYKIEFKQNN